jgi:phosphatidylserine/phosphatidylglycerophosphate/cardiolipin synthase-like enzyme
MSFRNRLTVLCALALGMGACAVQGPAEDPRDAAAIAAGKADGPYSDCELDALTDYVNELPLTTLDDEGPARATLRDQGVHGSAAKCIVWWRLGMDTDTSCPAGDLPAGFEPSFREFPDAQAIDDVHYVGPSAFEALNAINSASCDDTPEPGDVGVNVIFSPTDIFEQSHAARIVALINDPETRSVDISMYSFSQPDIKDALLANADRLSVRVMYDRGHLGGGLETELERAGIEVRDSGQINHHKFAIFNGVQNEGDDPAAATISSGTANWSNGAVGTYDESTVFISQSAEMTLRFQKEFNYLWEHSKAVDTGHDDTTNYFDTIEITDEMIEAVDDPTVDAWFTSVNFRPTSRGLSSDRSNGYQVAQRWIDMINGAEESIWIMQERLRSVPIANALLAKAEANPDIEIRVYQDNQEYVTAYKMSTMLRELQECYDEANTETQRLSCETGLVYSAHVAQAFEGNPNHEYRIKYYSYNWHYSFQQMHQKSMIIDGRWVVTGSYNWSYNAEFKTFENVMVFDGQAHTALLQAFQDNFEFAWNRGVDDYDDLMDRIQNGDGNVPIRMIDSLGLVPISMTWQQVDDYRNAVRDACGSSNVYQLGRTNERAPTCDRL